MSSAGGQPRSSDPASRGSTGGLLVVISGPSGVGKTSIRREIQRRLGGTFSVSATTRPPGPGEIDGRDYHFLSDEEFRRRLAAGDFLEHARVFGRSWYGTPREPIERALGRGELVLLDIDVQGGLQIRRATPLAMMIFVLPPSDEELLRRLRTRGRDDMQNIDRRFQEAQREIEIARSSGAYDQILVNDDFEQTVAHITAMIQQRRSRRMPTSP